MLATMGLGSLQDLYAHLPEAVKLNQPLKLPPGQSEYEIIDYFRRRSEEGANGYASFLEAGVYRHYRPVVIDSIVTRGEFLTAYTPYQPEVSQGTLQAIYEFQSMVCSLLDMEVANAGLYDGASALAEAALMACRVTGTLVD